MVTADKPPSSSKKSTDLKKLNAPLARKAPPVRKVPFGAIRNSRPLQRLAKKLPLHKVFGVHRQPRKIQNRAQVKNRKRVQKLKPKQFQKKLPVVQHRQRPLAKKVNNFARFLKAFSRQINRPVQ